MQLSDDARAVRFESAIRGGVPWFCLSIEVSLLPTVAAFCRFIPRSICCNSLERDVMGGGRIGIAMKRAS